MANNFNLTQNDYDALCLAAQRQDERAFNQLYLNFHKKVRNTVMKIFTADFVEAQAATNMAFAKLYRKMRMNEAPTFDKLESYVITIAKNEYLGRNESKTMVEITENTVVGHTLPQVMVSHEQLDLLKLGMTYLCDKCRGLLTKHYVEGYSYKEIAEDFSELFQIKNEDAAKTKANECRQKLKTYIKQLNTKKEISLIH